ncbi:phosphotransferase IIA-like nitrogen-regulatory protein PtsN [Nicoletella semolina]|uniref:Phosphotransferase IIA-like nitrogen-regulatory protein PtsN n=1 Tax=Nicoletella semolina TaxID=271160 RepID=A0A4R2N4Z8_9PAST|nr:PTS sugar transporter subunit IIA [Nicoletella semolina]MDH2924102.1 PTS sugar transporter subunit IIA [Nicoletella semolina]TCP15894.1 phosphotransferase IIA-like nitrogen-regulatory protein PtsN [Nicoletella semolina]
MKLTTFLALQNVQHNVFVSSKKRALELVAKLIAKQLNQLNQPNEALVQQNCAENKGQVCPIECFANLFKREKLGSTALNHGIALPHAKLSLSEPLFFNEPMAVFLQLENPIDYDASDHREVDLIYAILFPENDSEKYQDYLAYIGQVLTNKNVLRNLRAAESVEDIWQILDYAEPLG